MTREIKFRAKTVMDIEPLAMKKGYWVEGHYYEDLQDGEWCSWIQECNDITHYKVDKNTLGQFTGLMDKNGKEIYEGDIVDAWSAGGHLPNGIIKWGEGIAGFFIMPPKCNAVWHLVGNDENKETLEVLGNIHDNPELLKGGAE